MLLMLLFVIALQVLLVNATSDALSLFVTRKVSNACKSVTYTVEEDYAPNYHSSVVLFKTGTFPSPGFTPDSEVSLCAAHCPDFCCTSAECQATLNTNYDRIEPDTVYYLVHGGVSSSAGLPFDFRSPPKPTGFKFVSDVFYYISSKTKGVFWLEVIDSFPVAFQSGIVVERTVQGLAFHDYYFVGGISPACDQDAGKCSSFWRVALPSSPIQYGGEAARLEMVGGANLAISGSFGHCLAYFGDNSELLLFGGFKMTEEGFASTQALWSFNLDSYSWSEIQPQVNFTSEFTWQEKKYEFQQTGQQPSPRAFSSCHVLGKRLIILGGIGKIGDSSDSFLKDIWELDLESLVWRETTIPFFRFDTVLEFGPAFHPDFGAALATLGASYKLFETMSDFGQQFLAWKRSAAGVFTVVDGMPSCYYILNGVAQICLLTLSKAGACGSKKDGLLFSREILLEDSCFFNGNCEGGSCKCFAGFHGNTCRYRGCPNECGLKNATAFQAFSVAPKPNFNKTDTSCIYNFPESSCACSQVNMAAGDDCSKLLCINDCSKNGECDFATGMCSCRQPYDGPDCSIINISLDF